MGKSFGRVLQHLRKEYGISTQAELAARLNWGVAAVTQYELGSRTPSSERLQQLAEHFKMNPFEKDAFFLLGTDPAYDQGEQSEAREAKLEEAKTQRNSLIERIEAYRVPAVVMDSYGDIVCANDCLLQFFSPPHAKLQDAHLKPGNRNILRYIFDRELEFFERLGEAQWSRVAMQNIILWRARSLARRGDDVWRSIFARLRKLPQFTEYWDKAMYGPHDPSIFQNQYFAVKYDDKRMVNYYTQTSLIATPFVHDELSLVVYIPASSFTSELFGILADKNGNRVAEVFRNNPLWPGEKPYPTDRKSARSPRKSLEA